MTRTLVLGGARSGKSRYALGLGESVGLDRVFVATGVGFDVEMRGRIARHRADRDSSWRTVEEAVAVWDVIGRECREGRVVVLDCLTLWLNNLMLEGRDRGVGFGAVGGVFGGRDGGVDFGVERAGWGLPDTELGREFRDLHGRMNQSCGAVCDRVLFMVAGLPVGCEGLRVRRCGSPSP